MSHRLLVARNVSRGTVLAERLENASSLWGKFVGLMGRASLAPGAGMWLPGESGIHMLFMRFAIDVVWVAAPDGGKRDGARRVVKIRRALPPWRGVVWMVRGARGVLELPVGTIDATGTAVGDDIVVEG